MKNIDEYIYNISDIAGYSSSEELIGAIKNVYGSDISHSISNFYIDSTQIYDITYFKYSFPKFDKKTPNYMQIPEPCIEVEYQCKNQRRLYNYFDNIVISKMPTIYPVQWKMLFTNRKNNTSYTVILNEAKISSRG